MSIYDEPLTPNERLILIETTAHELTYTYPLKDEFYISKLNLIEFNVKKLKEEHQISNDRVATQNAEENKNGIKSS